MLKKKKEIYVRVVVLDYIVISVVVSEATTECFSPKKFEATTAKINYSY